VLVAHLRSACIDNWLQTTGEPLDSELLAAANGRWSIGRQCPKDDADRARASSAAD